MATLFLLSRQYLTRTDNTVAYFKVLKAVFKYGLLVFVLFFSFRRTQIERLML